MRERERFVCDSLIVARVDCSVASDVTCAPQNGGKELEYPASCLIQTKINRPLWPTRC